jgi:Leucine-rich repeat (LRR) protein
MLILKTTYFYIYPRLYSSFTHLLSLQLQLNRIKKLDRGLYYLKNLQVLRLDKNKLQSISQTEIVSCSNLIYLNISDNNISSITVC